MSSSVASSGLSETGDRQWGPRRVRCPVVPALGGDHEPIFEFLSPIFPNLSAVRFKASLDDPFYEPRDRLLLKRAGRVIAHVHLTHRMMQFGPLQIPVAGLKWLAIAPECRGRGFGSHLLAAAERQALQDGAVVGLLRTTIPRFFRRTGWALCGQPCSSAGRRARRAGATVGRRHATSQPATASPLAHSPVAPLGGRGVGAHLSAEPARHVRPDRPHPRLLAVAPPPARLRRHLRRLGRAGPLGPQGGADADCRLRGVEGPSAD